VHQVTQVKFNILLHLILGIVEAWETAVKPFWTQFISPGHLGHSRMWAASVTL
jgi:hypothetical protein